MCLKLISRKIWMVEKFSNFHTVLYAHKNYDACTCRHSIILLLFTFLINKFIFVKILMIFWSKLEKNCDNNKKNDKITKKTKFKVEIWYKNCQKFQRQVDLSGEWRLYWSPSRTGAGLQELQEGWKFTPDWICWKPSQIFQIYCFNFCTKVSSESTVLLI